MNGVFWNILMYIYIQTQMIQLCIQLVFLITELLAYRVTCIYFVRNKRFMQLE